MEKAPLDKKRFANIIIIRKEVASLTKKKAKNKARRRLEAGRPLARGKESFSE